MCGISGFIDKKGQFSEKHINLMLRSLCHRGPDDSGVYQCENIYLGHNRLSIIDLSTEAKQPMDFNGKVIVYNGEVYNYIELKNELIKLGHKFHTNSDTEVILHAYDEWGVKCLNMFRGMWAFVIFDKDNDKMIFCRDIFGVKPLYYSFNSDFICFASEIKPLLEFGIKPKVNKRILVDYLVAGFTDHTEFTFFEDIYQLMPGHYITIDVNNFNIGMNRYFDFKSEGEVVESLDSVLKKSIELHLRSDVPVGTCLSGGIDSSIICSIASKAYHKKSGKSFSAVTADSECPSNNEIEYAKTVVNKCNLNWFIASPGYKDFNDNIEKCLLAQGEPVSGISVFMQYWVMKKAKEIGLKVMLDGQGGDEFFLGYERYYTYYFLGLIKKFKIFSLVREVLLSIKNSKLSFFQSLLYFLYFTFNRIRLFRIKSRTSFIKKEYLSLVNKSVYKRSKGIFDLNKIQTDEIFTYSIPHLLRYEDRNSMAHSIEARVPLIDKDVMRKALSIKHQDLIKNGYTKFPLRLILDKEINSEIAWRKSKVGFEGPESLWIEKHKEKMYEKIFNSKILKNITKDNRLGYEKLDNNIIWRLYNIAVWEAQYNVEVT